MPEYKEEDHSRAEAGSPATDRSSRKPMEPVRTQDLKNLHSDSSSLVSLAAADRARLPAAALQTGSSEVSGCKSGASALPHGDIGPDQARETRH